MLIDTIVNFCDAEYQKKHCCDCSYKIYCPDERCDRCLHFIHTPSAAPAPRRYDCPNMANFYTCKYSYKYMSELIYALQQLKYLRNKGRLNVLSIGCGPCTELFALDFLKETGDYQFDSVEFRGIDLAKDVWYNIHEKIKIYDKERYMAKFYYKDIVDLIDTIVEVKWVPDLIVFQYVFSDMEKHCPQEKLQKFISKIADFINQDMHENTYIVLNDINLSTQMGGGREHFDVLLGGILDAEHRQIHFNNNNKPKHFDYGDEYESNDLLMAIPSKIQSYEPFDSCASAQLIIKKVIK